MRMISIAILLMTLTCAYSQYIPLSSFAMPQQTPIFVSPPNGHHPSEYTFSSPPVRHIEPVATLPAPVNEMIDNDTRPPPTSVFQVQPQLRRLQAQAFSEGQAQSFAASQQQFPSQQQLQPQQFQQQPLQPQQLQPQQINVGYSSAPVVSRMNFIGQGISYSF